MLIFAPQQYIAFVLASLLCIVAPGPDNLTVLSIGISKGRRAGVGFALGCALGCLTHTVWATIGVSAIIAASAPAFTVLKLAGAGYLAYLGAKALRSDGTRLDGPAGNGSAATTATYVSRGFFANALNPKVVLFFLAFLPQFVNRQARVSTQMALLGLTFAVLSAVVFSVLGYFSGYAGEWLKRRSGLTKWLDRATGCLFIGLALRLAVYQRAH